MTSGHCGLLKRYRNAVSFRIAAIYSKAWFTGFGVTAPFTSVCCQFREGRICIFCAISFLGIPGNEKVSFVDFLRARWKQEGKC